MKNPPMCFVKIFETFDFIVYVCTLKNDESYLI